MTDPITTVGLVVLFLVLEAFFSGSEIAAISMNRFRLRHLAETGNSAAKGMMALIGSPDRLFGTTSIGTNISVFSGTAIVTSYLVGIFGDRGDIIAAAIMTPVTLFFGEILPKTVFQARADSIGAYLFRPLSLAEKALSPAVAATSFVSKRLFAILGISERSGKAIFATREEVRQLAHMGRRKLDLHAEERLILDRIFRFRGITAEDVMVPLVNIEAVEAGSPIESVRERFRATGFSRLPVFQNRIYNIVGQLRYHDVLTEAQTARTAADIMRPAYFVPWSKKADDLLAIFRDTGMSMSVVVDEYGGAIGIVTVEEILEEIVGEIEDEFDTAMPQFETAGPGEYIIDALAEVEMLNDSLGLGIPDGDYETVAGFVLDSLERIPARGELLGIGRTVFRVESTTPRGIRKLRVKILSAESGGEQTETGSDNPPEHGPAGPA